MMDDDLHNMSSPLKEGKLLQEIQREILLENTPLIIILLVSAFIGIIGNILTIRFYGYKVKQTPTFVMILLLAIVDLIVCFLGFTTIADLYVNVMFTNDILCRCMHFSFHWFIMSSYLIVWVISIHRYRKICKPVGRELTNRSAKGLVAITISFAMVYSAQIFLVFKTVEINLSPSDNSTHNLTGHVCTVSDDSDFQDFIFLFQVNDMIILLIVIITFVFTYGNIWRTVRRHKRTATTIQMAVSSNSSMKRTIQKGLESIGTENESRDITANQFGKLQTENMPWSGNDLGRSLDDSENLSITTTPPSKSSNARTRQNESTANAERNVTLMLFAVTVGLVLCFTPFSVWALYLKNEQKHNIFLELAQRSPYYNSIINPIIICIFNPQYRRYVFGKLADCHIRKT